MTTVTLPSLKRFVHDILLAMGLPEEEAEIFGGALVFSELRFHPGHGQGVKKLRCYWGRFSEGGINWHYASANPFGCGGLHMQGDFRAGLSNRAVVCRVYALRVLRLPCALATIAILLANHACLESCANRVFPVRRLPRGRASRASSSGRCRGGLPSRRA